MQESEEMEDPRTQPTELTEQDSHGLTAVEAASMGPAWIYTSYTMNMILLLA